MDPITSIHEAAVAATRLASLKGAISSVRDFATIDAMTDAERQRMNWIADDMEGDFDPTIEALEAALAKWAEIECYGSPQSPAADRAEYLEGVL